MALALAIYAAGVADAAPRSAAVRAEFQRLNPCPANGAKRGACPGWDVEHTIPLCAGGADHLSNLTWMRKEDHREKTRRDLKICRELRKLPKRDE